MMTPDIRAAHAYLQARGVTMLRGIVYHDDWGGTDVHIADPDGNAIQVVQYGHQEPDG
jgi:predicted enzyme related to lactoylglutathione lyase